jgi:hypothetical protein
MPGNVLYPHGSIIVLAQAQMHVNYAALLTEAFPASLTHVVELPKQKAIYDGGSVGYDVAVAGAKALELYAYLNGKWALRVGWDSPAPAQRYERGFLLSPRCTHLGLVGPANVANIEFYLNHG